MGWVITQDHFKEPCGAPDCAGAKCGCMQGREGYGQVAEEAVTDGFSMVNAGRIIVQEDLTESQIEDPKVPFKLYGDDMDLAYSGVISESWLNGEEHLAFAPLRFGEADYGCTIMKYRNPNTGEWEHL